MSNYGKACQILRASPSRSETATCGATVVARTGAWYRDVLGEHFINVGGGLFLIWSGVKELRLKIKGVEHEVESAATFGQVLFTIVSLNLLFSVDSILTVVGMTDNFAVMVGSVVISVALMLIFAKPLARFLKDNPDFEILGLFVLLLIGFVLFLEGGHVAEVSVNSSDFPYIPQWIVIFTLMLMFSVDLYQNWWERKREKEPVVDFEELVKMMVDSDLALLGAKG